MPARVLILAAGRGRRMGAPKALMPVAGVGEPRPWWRHQQDRLARADRPPLWVVSPDVRAAMRESAPPHVQSDPDAPMFASVLAGLSALRAAPPGWVHVLPVDVPAPAPATFAALEAAAGPRGVAVPRFRGRTGHPLCLAWSWIEEKVFPVAAPDQRLDALTAPARVVVDVDDPAVAANLNTPDDLRRWLAT